jgi:hypothetical protein
MTTKFYTEIEDIKKDIYTPLKCGLLEEKGTTINIADCNIESTNVEIIDSNKTRFAKNSKMIRIKKLENINNYEINIHLPKTINANRFFLTFYMTNETADTSKGSYFDVRYNNMTNNIGHNNGCSIVQNWNNLEIHVSNAQNFTNIKLVFTLRANAQVGEVCGIYWLDSLTFGAKMKPTFILNFDQWWQDSIDNGGYQYCFDNNIPFTLMTKNYDSLSDTFLNLAKKAETEYNCENSYYASYGANNTSLLNASTFDDAVDEVKKIKNDFITVMKHDLVSFGCTQMKLNYLDRLALLNSGFKMIRGGASQMIPYFDNDDFWTPSIGISSDTISLETVKTQIDNTIKYGLCMIAFTHGVCNDGETTMSGTQSNGMNITDFKAMIDYLVELRDSGYIQVCTMEEWYNQCIGISNV